ncbi:MAG: hypothetical protein ACREUK_06040 [Burkholderiales bacterium]
MAPDPAPSPPERVSRARDAARALPLIGMFLLLPPVIGSFAAPVAVAGVPLVVLYLFSVWLALVLAAALLARALAPRDSPSDASPRD